MTRITSEQVSPGGVLGAELIRARHNEIFASEFSDDCVQAASYDVRVATTKMILPTGRRVPEGDLHSRPFVLEPGGVAFVSTRERLHMPRTVSGNISIKFTYASQGILILTGMIVDPGYGSDVDEGRRLHFLLANVGQEPLSIRPGADRIASLQFLPVLSDPSEAAPVSRVATSPTIIDELFAEPSLPLGLSFFESQARLEREVAALRTKVEESVRGLDQVILFGHFLLSTAILGVVFTIILGWVNDATLRRRLETAVELLPDTPYAFLSMTVLAVALFIGLPIVMTRAASKLSSMGRSRQRGDRLD